MSSAEHLIRLIVLAGWLQIGIVAANALLPGGLRYRENLLKVSPIVRQVFIVHSLYILLVLVVFGGMCILFARDLVSGGALGRYLSAALAAFWLSRLIVQLCYYDAEVRRQYRSLDALFILALVFLAAVFSVAAIGVGE